ncbi:MAG: acylglycerol kinase family protein [Ardenticatenaceae bacterium]|nr:acylglycerol kinase family protein [Ardenticatenaceae bacterium]
MPCGELARRAADDGYDLVVAAGGDGTISDVVNGLVRGSKAVTKLGIIPIGSGNDLAWSLKIPTKVETAVQKPSPHAQNHRPGPHRR